jgi:UDP-3-O-[3-hydroxymyristoyl] glucosamine N-acyltransferase
MCVVLGAVVAVGSAVRVGSGIAVGGCVGTGVTVAVGASVVVAGSVAVAAGTSVVVSDGSGARRAFPRAQMPMPASASTRANSAVRASLVFTSRSCRR